MQVFQLEFERESNGRVSDFVFRKEAVIQAVS